MSIYHDQQRQLQDAFDTRRLADVIETHNLHDTFNPLDTAFIATKDFFFLATADSSGKPSCSFKAGPVGFVKVVNDRTLGEPTRRLSCSLNPASSDAIISAADEHSRAIRSPWPSNNGAHSMSFCRTDSA
ncbi:pyridoxamine 5'-phosphate oxidase family protein [Variovorax sp. MHTC-1]|uniref:pyridoxamine 5'-phosphate oxidase family protein n=1 Tax=Variovorax sp. MHTC-1 TaxID=2495593 RepID=UPI003917B77E